MDIHKNARLTPLGRERLVKMVLSGQTPQAASEAAGVCPRTARKWLDRSQAAKAWPACRIAARGPIGCASRRRRPVIERIEALRRQRMTGKEIAAEVGVSAATVSRVLKRLGLNKLSALEPAEPPRRYQREQPGELIHIDIKKLGNFNTDRPSHHRRPHAARATTAASAGSSSMSASTTPRASPSARS